MLVRMEGNFSMRGYACVMNKDPARRDAMRDDMLKQHARLNDFLVEHAPAGDRYARVRAWRVRPWPPQDKYGHSATDEELGL